MKIVHIKLTFEDIFSGATEIKTCTRSENTFEEMKKSIGSITRVHSNSITFEWKLIKIEQC
jgi:hypothetical protein